jgi:hypothetical protein
VGPPAELGRSRYSWPWRCKVPCTGNHHTNSKGLVRLSLRTSALLSSSWVASTLTCWWNLASCFRANRRIAAVTISILRSMIFRVTVKIITLRCVLLKINATYLRVSCWIVLFYEGMCFKSALCQRGWVKNNRGGNDSRCVQQLHKPRFTHPYSCEFDVYSSVHRDTWYDFYKMTKKMQLYRIIYYSMSTLHVSSDIFAHPQEHLNCITASGITHVCLLVLHTYVAAGWQRHTCVIPEAVIQFRFSWWWAKISLETCTALKE